MVLAHSTACSLSVVMPGEAPPQLDRSRELATLLVDGADRSGIRPGDDEHPRSMRMTLPRVELLSWLGGDARGRRSTAALTTCAIAAHG